MRGAQRHFPTGTAIPRLIAWLVVLTLIAGCDNPGPSVATPTTIAQTPDARATSSASVPTVEQSSPVPSPVPTASAPPSASSPTIRWRQGNWYLLGVNYPYVHYGNDFGSNKWGSNGVHDPGTYSAVDADFARISSLGVRTVRWFVFADGRAGIIFDSSGMPSGLDEYVTRDLDAALDIAERHNISLDLVLLDYRFMWDARTENGVQLGGHASVLATPAGQQALVHNVFEPLFRRYANHPAILSWEVMNEPEWGLIDAGRVNREISQPLDLATFRAFAQLVVGAIHSEAGSYATIGCADVKWAQNWVGLGLDYYQIHYYDWMKPYSTDNLFGMTAESLHLDHPVVIGEFPGDHSVVAGLRQYLDTWYASGYAGAWPWSFRPDATWGSPDTTVLHAWADAHHAAVAIPIAPAAATAAAAATATVQASTYTVVSGDTLYRIAVRFGTTPEAIMEANSLTSTVIQPGQVLVIPRGTPTAGAGTPLPAASTTPTAP